MGEELLAEHHNTNREILQQLCNEASPEVVKVLKIYNYDEEGEVIVKEMNKCPKKELVQAAEYLQNISTEELKQKLVLSIIDRIDSLLLEFCRKCNTFYHNKKEDIPCLSCNKCGQGAHEECYKEISTALANYPGIAYLCGRCVSPTPKDNPTPRVNVQSTQDEPTNEESQITPGQQQEVSEPDLIEEPPICQRYRRGICPHGISGLTKVEGKVCEFAHPKRCQKLCIYGPYGENGCDKGRDCEFFHPILCRYSMKYRRCVNRSCKFTHLRGTRRYKSRDGHENKEPTQFSNVTATVDSSQPQINPWHSQENPESQNLSTATPSDPVNNLSNSPFLVELIQHMIEMKREIKEVREMQLYHPSPLPTMFSPLPYQPPPQSNINTSNQNLHHPVQVTNPRGQQSMPQQAQAQQAASTNNSNPNMIQHHPVQMPMQQSAPVLPMNVVQAHQNIQ